jgi:hypothetical protein
MQNVLKCLVLITLLILCGCASTDKVVLDSTKRTPTTSVDLFKAGEKPTRTFKEIARLSFMGPREMSSRRRSTLLNKLKNSAQTP